MADEKAKKVNKGKKVRVKTDVLVMAVLLVAIAIFVGVQCYNAIHVDVKTVTALKSTVYESFDAEALVIRNEHIVDSDKSSVTVPCVADGEKVNVGGNIAMVFDSSENAKSYSSSLDLQKQLDYYINLESKSAGTATDVEQIDKDVLTDVNEYIQNSASGNISKVQSSALDLNDKLTRRQMIIGEDIDFSSVKQSLEKQINSINVDACKPSGYLTTDESGIFSSYTDGLETAFNYENIDKLDISTFDKYMNEAKSAKKSDNLGKLITDFEWYFACKVTDDQVKDINDGDTLSVALKDSDKVIECEVVSGATLDLGTKESVLILRSNDMDSELASMRLEDIEIRYNEYTGIKVPTSALHIDKKGNKIVYTLVADFARAKTGEIIYSTKDYVLFEYDTTDKDAIRIYDQIITQGKDLHDGKDYSR